MVTEMNPERLQFEQLDATTSIAKPSCMIESNEHIEAMSAHSPQFLELSLQLLKKNGELLLLIRAPSSAGHSEFHMVRTEPVLKKFISDAGARVLFTIVTEFSVLKRGIVTSEFIDDALCLPEPREGDWMVLGKSSTTWHKADWAWAENHKELREELEYRMGDPVSILKEPDWRPEAFGVDAYIPDDDGVVRRGVY